MTGNGSFGDDDPTPPGPQVPPAVREDIAPVDTWRKELLRVFDQLGALRRERIEYHERPWPLFKTRIHEIKKAHVAMMQKQVDEEEKE